MKTKMQLFVKLAKSGGFKNVWEKINKEYKIEQKFFYTKLFGA